MMGDGCCSCTSCSTTEGVGCFAVMVGVGDEHWGPMECWVLGVRAGVPCDDGYWQWRPAGGCEQGEEAAQGSPSPSRPARRGRKLE